MGMGVKEAGKGLGRPAQAGLTLGTGPAHSRAQHQPRWDPDSTCLGATPRSLAGSARWEKPPGPRPRPACPSACRAAGGARRRGGLVLTREEPPGSG